MARINSPAELEILREEILSTRDPNKPCITLCSGSACHASGSREVAARIEEEIEKQGLGAAVDLRKTGCHGFCERGPIIVIHPEEICYFQIKPEDVPEILSQTIREKKVVERDSKQDLSVSAAKEILARLDGNRKSGQSVRVNVSWIIEEGGDA